MPKTAIDKIHTVLIHKKNKYKILSWFYRTKKLIVDFKDFKTIDSKHVVKQIELQKPKKINAFFPKKINEQARHIEIKTFSTEAFLLQNILVSSESSLLLSLDKKEAFYEAFAHSNSQEFAYNNVDVRIHSHNLAKINHYKVSHFPGENIVLNTWFTTNYFHFLLEILSKVQFLTALPIKKNAKLFLVSEARSHPNFKTLAEIFLKDYDVNYLEKNTYYHFDTFWMLTSPNQIVPNLWQGCHYQADYAVLNPDSLHYIRTTISNFYKDKGNNHPKPSKIYLARKSGARQYNESEILEIAVKMGFTPLYFEDLSIEQQVITIQNADYILGPSGAAWSNLLFAKPKAKALIWMGTIWNDFSVFSTIAEIMQVDLSYYRNVSESDTYHEDYNLDPVVMEDLIQKLLNKI